MFYLVGPPVSLRVNMAKVGPEDTFNRSNANTTSTLSSLSVHTFWPHSVQAYSFCPLLLLNFRQKLVLHVPLGMLYIMSLALSGAFIRVTATSRTEKVAV